MSTTEISASDAEGLALFGLADRRHPALRIAIVACFFGFCFVAPLLFLCGQTTRTRSSIEQPEFSRATFLDGRYMASLETWLREDSPLTYQMRGIWSEIRFALGVLDSTPVMIGRDGFLYSRGITRLREAHLGVARAKRTKVLAEVRDRAHRLGVDVLVVPVPDTVTIYPEHAPLSPEAAAARAGLYQLVLDEIRAQGLQALDLRTPFLAFKAHELMYLRGDTHWTDSGARAAAVLVAEYLLAPPRRERIGPEVSLRGDDQMVLIAGDLLAQLGMRSNPGPRRPIAGPLRSVEVTVESSLVASRRENHVAWNVVYLGPPVPDEPNATYEQLMCNGSVALCGDSYANRSFKWRLALELKRLLDWTHVGEDAVAWQTISECLDAIEKGQSKAKVIVWEFAERKFCQDL